MATKSKKVTDKYKPNQFVVHPHHGAAKVIRKVNKNVEIFVEEFLHTGLGSLSKKYSSQSIDPDTLKAKSQKLEYEDEFINIGEEDYWILNSRTIKYLNQNQEEEIQKFVFEDIFLLN